MDASAALWQEEAQRSFRWMLGLSCGFHLLVFASWSLAPTGQGAFTLPGEAVLVELVAPLSAPAQPLPAPVAAAKPAPLPPSTVVLPETPSPPEETRPPPADLAELLARFRSEAGEERPPAEGEVPKADAQPPGASAAADEAAGRVRGAELSLKQKLWMRNVDTHVRLRWVLPPELRDQNLSADAEVLLGATGAVRRVTLRRSSGNTAFDLSVERALYRASPLPAPPEPGNWIIHMVPRRELP